MNSVAALEPGEFDELLRAVRRQREGVRDALCCLLLHDSAMRIEDALSVELTHFSDDRSLVRVWDGKWRTDKQYDTLPVSQRTIEQLDLYLPERPQRTSGPLLLTREGMKVYQQHYQRLLARLGPRVLGKHVYPHMLRATRITDLACGVPGVSQPAPLPLVQQFARHKNLATTQRYIAVRPAWADELRELGLPVSG